MPLPSYLTRPISYRAQCWIAWTGLTGFAATAWLDWRADAVLPPVKVTAMVLSVAWGIDLVRARRSTPERGTDGPDVRRPG